MRLHTSGKMRVRSPYPNLFLFFLHSILSAPRCLFFHVLSYCVSAYTFLNPPVDDTSLSAFNAFRCLIFGPLCGALAILLLPINFLTLAINILLILYFDDGSGCTLLSLEEKEESNWREDIRRDFYTFSSANLMMCWEFAGRFQNLSNSIWRSRIIADVISDCRHPVPLLEENLSVLKEDSPFSLEEKKNNVVCTEWYPPHFLCLQEVWDGPAYTYLIHRLRHSYSHFVVDVRMDGWSNNYFLGSTGQFIASKYPILETHVYFVKAKTWWSKLFPSSCVAVKVDLRRRHCGKRVVGYFVNLHLPSYENSGLSSSAPKYMSELQTRLRLFMKDTHKPQEEVIAFDVIGGDFNLDNISPCDELVHDHNLFEDYVDFPRKVAGEDKAWSMGTEIRLLNINSSVFRSPESFKKVLIDDVKRRDIIQDANLMSLTNFEVNLHGVTPNSDGQVVAEPKFGGKRRIDRLIFNPLYSELVSFKFSTALTNYTDHLPVILAVKMTGNAEQEKDSRN